MVSREKSVAKLWRIPSELSISAFSDFMSGISRLLNRGGVIIFPTDTVYGIGCLPHFLEAVEKVINVKERESNKGLPLLAASLKDVERVAIITPEVRTIMEEVWPGATTLLLSPRESGIAPLSPLILGSHSTVAVRIPGLNILQKMIASTGGLWVGTSANISNQEPIRSAMELYLSFKLKVDGIIVLDEPSNVKAISGVPSKIIDVTRRPPQVLRG